jgi:hypothetical protein
MEVALGNPAPKLGKRAVARCYVNKHNKIQIHDWIKSSREIPNRALAILWHLIEAALH